MKNKKTHIWIYAYKDDDTVSITQQYWHPQYLEDISLIPLDSDWHYRLMEDECDCDEI